MEDVPALEDLPEKFQEIPVPELFEDSQQEAYGQARAFERQGAKRTVERQTRCFVVFRP